MYRIPRKRNPSITHLPLLRPPIRKFPDKTRRVIGYVRRSSLEGLTERARVALDYIHGGFSLYFGRFAPPDTRDVECPFVFVVRTKSILHCGLLASLTYFLGRSQSRCTYTQSHTPPWGGTPSSKSDGPP